MKKMLRVGGWVVFTCFFNKFSIFLGVKIYYKPNKRKIPVHCYIVERRILLESWGADWDYVRGKLDVVVVEISCWFSISSTYPIITSSGINSSHGGWTVLFFAHHSEINVVCCVCSVEIQIRQKKKPKDLRLKRFLYRQHTNFLYSCYSAHSLRRFSVGDYIKYLSCLILNHLYSQFSLLFS